MGYVPITKSIEEKTKATKNCPKCGAGPRLFIGWTCGSYMLFGRMFITDKCAHRYLTQAKPEEEVPTNNPDTK